MTKLKLSTRLVTSLLVMLKLTLMINPANAYLTPFLIGTDPVKDSPASMDIVEVYLTNNGTHFQFIVKCRSVPIPSYSSVYRVYLDTKSGGAATGVYIGADYYLEAKDDSYLYEWNGGIWMQKSPIESQVDSENKTISLTAKLDDIGYPNDVLDTIGIVAATFKHLSKLRDKAPDTDNYTIAHNVIPELPWPTPLVFIPAVVATVYFIYNRRFQSNG